MLKRLEGRELEIVTSAIQEMNSAAVVIQKLIAEGRVLEVHFANTLELITGHDPTGLKFDMETNEIFEDVEEEVSTETGEISKEGE